MRESVGLRNNRLPYSRGSEWVYSAPLLVARHGSKLKYL